MQVHINPALAALVLWAVILMKGLNAVAGSVSNNACATRRLADLTYRHISALVARVTETKFPVPRLEIIAKFSHFTFQSDIEQIIVIGELLTSGPGVVKGPKPNAGSHGRPGFR